MSSLFLESLRIFFLGCLVPLSITTIASTLISLIQTITQIQEQSISFLIKILGLMLSLFFFGNEVSHLIVVFTVKCFELLVQQ